MAAIDLLATFSSVAAAAAFPFLSALVAAAYVAADLVAANAVATAGIVQ
jgi:hypothetical protein